MANEMDEKKDQPTKISTCFEGTSFAEMMQKIMDKAGIGSLCEERMRSLTERRRESKEELKEKGKEEGHGKEE